MQLDLGLPQRILFGEACAEELPLLVRKLGRKALLVAGSRLNSVVPTADALRHLGVDTILFSVSGEPTTVVAAAAGRTGRETGCDVVVACGGGSVLDTGKIAAVLMTNSGDLCDYLEVIGGGKQLERPGVPAVLVPTTAGTGTEATRNSVLHAVEHKVKVSVRSPYLLPAAAVVDPELSYSLPPAPTASTGMDALTQLIESFVSIRHNSFTDGLCREAIPKAAAALPRAFRSGSDKAARRDMSLAALFSGIALANAGLGAVHGIAGPLGGMIGAPHGALCAALLPAACAVNIEAARRAGDAETGGRYRDTARLVSGRSDAQEKELPSLLRRLGGELEIRGLKQLGLEDSAISGLVGKSLAASSMKGNPVRLGADEVELIIRQSL